MLPTIVKDFHLDPTTGGWLVSLNSVGTLIGGIGVGGIGDVFGKGPRRAWIWAGTVPLVIA